MADLATLNAWAGSTDWAVRAQAAKELVALGDVDAKPTIIKLLADPDNSAVSNAALLALLDVEAPWATEAICSVVHSDHEEIGIYLLEELEARWELVQASGLRQRIASAVASRDPEVAAGAEEIAEELGWSSR